jgi:hypothetical protein
VAEILGRLEARPAWLPGLRAAAARGLAGRQPARRGGPAWLRRPDGSSREGKGAT